MSRESLDQLDVAPWLFDHGAFQDVTQAKNDGVMPILKSNTQRLETDTDGLDSFFFPFTFFLFF